MSQPTTISSPTDVREQKIADASFEYWKNVYASNCWGKIYDTTVSEATN